MRRNANVGMAALSAAIFLLCVTIVPAAAPGFLTGSASGDPGEIAAAYLRDNRAALGLDEADVREAFVRDRYRTDHNGVTHVYFSQRLRGIEVFNGVINVNITRDGSITSIGNRFMAVLS